MQLYFTLNHLIHSSLLHPNLITFNSNWQVIWLPITAVMTVEKGSQITSQLQLKVIYMPA